jgi:hypothetical protein
VAEPIARQAFATGRDPEDVARTLADRLRAPDLRIAFVFADRRLPPATMAGIQHALPAPVVGCSTVGVLGVGVPQGDEPVAVGLGLYGDWLRVGVGVAAELSKAALTRSRDAVRHAAAALGLSVDALDPARHIAVTLLDGGCNHEEAFCIGSAAAAPKIRFVGGSASADLDQDHRAYVWAHGEVMFDAGLVILLDSARPFYPVSSAHMTPTELRTVVTAASGRVIHELDGRPAAPRLRELVASIGDRLDEPRPAHTLARYIDGVPYVRSLHRIAEPRLVLASAVETGHILRVMRPGDLIQTTRRDLGVAAERVGGTMAAFLAFSCIGRHVEAANRGGKHELSAAYAAYPTVGFQTLSEQSGILLVNHTLTGLAIGASTP